MDTKVFDRQYFVDHGKRGWEVSKRVVTKKQRVAFGKMGGRPRGKKRKP